MPTQADWPFNKLDACCQSLAGATKIPAVLVASGNLCPIHNGHIFMMEQARDRLERAGYAVIGAYLSPHHNDLMAAEMKSPDVPLLSSAFRLKMAELALKSSSFESVTAWECTQAKAPSIFELIRECQEKVSEHCETMLGYKQVRTFYVVGSVEATKKKLDKGLHSRNVNLAHEQGVIIVPRGEDDDMLLMEHPHELVFIADPAPGEACGHHSHMVWNALRNGDTPYLIRAIPQAAVRLLLAPTAAERLEFKEDLEILGNSEVNMTTGSWPMLKVRQQLMSLTTGIGGKSPAVLVTAGVMSPTSRRHLAMLCAAKQRLERAGYHVLGAWVIPTDESHALPALQKLGFPEISAEWRMRCAELAVADDEFVSVSNWATSHTPQLAEALSVALQELCEAVHKRFEGSLQHCKVRGFVCCSQDYEGKYQFSKNISATQMQGTVIVPLGDEEALLEKPAKKLFVADPVDSVVAAMTTKKILTAIKNYESQYVARAVPGAAARFILTPTAKERDCFSKEFTALGIPVVGQGQGGDLCEKVKTSFKAWIGPDGKIASDDLAKLMQMIDPSWTSTELATLFEGQIASKGDIMCDDFVDWIFSGRMPRGS